MMIHPAQCRAARGLLDLSQAEMAARAGLARRTVAVFEAGQPVAPDSAAAIARALAGEGVELLSGAGGALGVLQAGTKGVIEPYDGCAAGFAELAVQLLTDPDPEVRVRMERLVLIALDDRDRRRRRAG